MSAKSKATKSVKYDISAKKADQKILQLFPSLNYTSANSNSKKSKIRQQLACLNLIGNQSNVNSIKLSHGLKVDRSEVTKITKQLSDLGLIKIETAPKTSTYNVTTAGSVALLAFDEFQEWAKIKSSLAVPTKKNDALAYALLVIGFCANKPDSIYQTLSKYASHGNTFENIPSETAAEYILSFYRQELRSASPTPPTYLNVFKEFTTAGFQEVFRMLLVAIKPTAEDYNWLIEFFNEVSEFYFDPARIAFVNLLAENPKLSQHLEDYKKTQDQQIKKQGGNLEVTFSIPGSGMSKVDAMPPHLRAIGMRLILEPIKFINKELVEFFWSG
jgi:DNA-binding MarR family transcriptional regulator